jgi:DtxR family transcriptional regulator, Mn-dependent transcriptional regulator
LRDLSRSVTVTYGPRAAGSRRVFLDATGTYLRTIYELEEERDIPPTRAEVRARLGVTRSAANQFVGQLTQQGMAEVSGDHRVRLSAAGRDRAERVMRKHRLAERLLVDLVGLEWELAHLEASSWQHVLGEQVERRLLRLLDPPWVSPYGNPIPALAELGSVDASPTRPGASAGAGCDRLARDGGGLAIVREVSERAQDDVELLRRLRSAGVLPGALVEVEPARSVSGPVSLRGSGCGLSLGNAAAGMILVARAEPASARPPLVTEPSSAIEQASSIARLADSTVA